MTRAAMNRLFRPSRLLPAAYSVRSASSSNSSASRLPESADVVIVGAGSIGCSTFYHLTKMGVANVLLLDKHKVTSGTTWHTAGLLWNLRPNDLDIPILTYTAKLIGQILPEELDGDSAGFINNGGLFIATTAERLDEYKRLHSLGKAFGVESHLLDPSETKQLYPLLNVSDVYGALYSPADGVMDPAQWTAALTKMGRRRGGTLLEDCAVTAVDTVTDELTGLPKVVGVQTSLGYVKTRQVVNSSGAWGPDVAKYVGQSAPTMAYRHAYCITDSIEGIRNMPNVRDHDGSFYLRLQGESLQVGGYESNPKICGRAGELPFDFSFGLYEVDWERNFFHIINAATNRLPVLETTGIKSEICGPLSFTIDDNPICGYAPDMQGYFYACGFDLGMMMGGGAGDQLAKWIVRGRPELHLHSWDVRRFNPRVVHGNDWWLRERTHERYVNMYKAVYPHDEPLAGRNQLLSPFADKLAQKGCVFQERHGWERPGWFLTGAGDIRPRSYQWYGSEGHTVEPDPYEDALKMDYTFDFPKSLPYIKEECLAAREKVAGFDMSYFGKFYLSGPDAGKAVDWVFSNDMRKPPGTAVYTCMLNEHGGVEADLCCSVVPSGSDTACDPKFDEPQGYYITAGGGSAYHDWVHIQNACREKGYRVTLTDRSHELGLLSIQGPNSRALLQRLAPDVDLSNDAFPFGTTKTGVVAGHLCRLMRLSFVGELGWELHIPTESCAPVYEAVERLGADLGYRDAGYRAIESLAAEKGYRSGSGNRAQASTTRQMFQFLGQRPATVGHAARGSAGLHLQDAHRRRLQGQTGRARPAARRGQAAHRLYTAARVGRTAVVVVILHCVMLHPLATVLRDGQPVGFVRRAEWAFALDRPVGYAYLRRPDGGNVTLDWINSGVYSVESLGRLHKVTVSHRSPFDPKHRRIHGHYPTADTN